MENRSHALIAGLFTIVLALAAALALWWFSGTRELTHTYLLETRGSVTGLNFEAQVRYRGIRAGKVRGIRPDPADPGLLLVEISLARQYVLTDRTIARLNQQGITGLAYVMLEEGADGTGTPLATDGSARLAIRPGLLDTLGDQAGDIAAQVAELATRLNRLLDERNADNIALALDNLAVASAGLKELPQLVAALRAALSDANLERLRAILAHLERTTGEAAPLAAEARALVASLGELTQRVDAALAAAGSLGARIEGDTLPRAAELMTEVRAATRRLERFLETLDETPQALLFGAPPAQPGPGEPGFVSPRRTE